MNNNNIVNLVGTIAGNYEYSHEICGESFYMVDVSTMRSSGVCDMVPVMVSSRIVDTGMDMTGMRIEINGTFRSHNIKDGYKSRLILYVFADTFTGTDKPDENIIEITGSLCKAPTYRKTPLGREITDALVAVNRKYGKSDYIPVIAWSRNAGYLSELETGTKIHTLGRIQSREYCKVIAGDVQKRLAYEISSAWIEVVYDEVFNCEDREPEPVL